MLITIDDTSPTISYFPVSDTLSTPSLYTSWNPYFSVSGFADAPTASGQVGVGTSFHVTSLDGASFTMVWVGECSHWDWPIPYRAYSHLSQGREYSCSEISPRGRMISLSMACPLSHPLLLCPIPPPTSHPLQPISLPLLLNFRTRIILSNLHLVPIRLPPHRLQRVWHRAYHISHSIKRS